VVDGRQNVLLQEALGLLGASVGEGGVEFAKSASAPGVAVWYLRIKSLLIADITEIAETIRCATE